MADVLYAPVHQLEDPQYTTCVGAALLGFQRLGHVTFEEFPSIVRVRRIFEPNPANRTLYDTLFRQFVRAFHRNRPIFRTLNRETS